MVEEVARSVRDVAFACEEACEVRGWEWEGADRCSAVLRLVVRRGGGTLHAAALLPFGYARAERVNGSRFRVAGGCGAENASESLHLLLCGCSPEYRRLHREEVERRVRELAAGGREDTG